VGGEAGTPASLTVFSRDEAKQHYMRLDFLHQASATDDVIYRESTERVHFFIGDVRRYPDVKLAADRADVIFHAAALKQVPTCEYFPSAAVDTNVTGAVNLARALSEGAHVEKTVVGISTDKACKPVNVMGMTKALQERILAQANIDAPWVRFVNVRYGNVMASRGSAIPYFIDLVRQGKPIPITDKRMTRFLMTLNQSVDLILTALRGANRGETFIPVVPSALITETARAVAGDQNYPLQFTAIRPGEKLDEILISEEERPRTVFRAPYLVILPVIPELRVSDAAGAEPAFAGEYSSAQNPLSYADVRAMLTAHHLTADLAPTGREIYT
jgi:UDP-glucose 4-epimerase